MLKQSKLFIDAIKSDLRDIKARVYINNIEYDDEHLMSIDAQLASITGSEFEIGSAITDSATVVFSELVETIAPLDKVVIEIGAVRGAFPDELKKLLNMKVGSARVGARLNNWNPESEIEWVQLGEFYISDHVDVDYNEKKTTITCKDKMIFLEDDYESQLDYPNYIDNIVVEIANQAGVEVDTLNIESLPSIEITEPIGYTMREALSKIAQIAVGFVSFNRQGRLQIRSLENAEYEISMKEYYSKGLTKTGIRYRVGGISCNVDNDDGVETLHAGQRLGPQINIENNLVTQEILNGMYEKLKEIDYYPFNLEWRGNPALEAGDLITVKDDSGNDILVPNLNYRLSYNGGLSATSTAKTKSRVDITPSGRKPLQQQIADTNRRIKSESKLLEDAFKDAQSKITGNQGGYIITRLNEDGKPYELLVMDTEDINSASNVIRLNQQGIGFSQNGYNGPFGVAITIDGQIVADYITAGTLSAELIQSGFNKIVAGTSITQEGIRQVDASGEYAIMQGGGMRFYTASDTLNGSIESSYQGSESSGGETGVGIFIEPGRKFNLVRHYPGSEDNVTIFDVPIDADELRLRRNLNAYSRSIYDANTVRTRNDINESVFRTWGSGESFVGGTNGARFGYYADATYHTKFLLPKSGTAELFTNLSMKNQNINNIHTLYTGDANVEYNLFIGSGGSLFRSTTNDPHTGHKPLVIDANGTLGLSVNGYQHFRTFRYSSGSSGTHFFTDINMQGYTISNQSDVRLKTKIKKANVDALREIDRLEFIYYEWDREKKPEYPEGVQFGIKAQYSPFLQRKNAGEDSYLSIDMMKQVNLNSKGIQELYHENIALKERIEALEAI